MASGVADLAPRLEDVMGLPSFKSSDASAWGLIGNVTRRQLMPQLSDKTQQR